MNLLPCPFCGSTDVRVVGVTGYFYAACRCHAHTRLRSTRTDAAAEWNTRTPGPPDSAGAEQ